MRRGGDQARQAAESRAYGSTHSPTPHGSPAAAAIPSPAALQPAAVAFQGQRRRRHHCRTNATPAQATLAAVSAAVNAAPGKGILAEFAMQPDATAYRRRHRNHLRSPANCPQGRKCKLGKGEKGQQALGRARHVRCPTPHHNHTWRADAHSCRPPYWRWIAFAHTPPP